MQPIDIEDALQSAINTYTDVTASAPPLPPDYQSSLPFCRVTRIGGSTLTRVSERHSVDFDVYADTWAAATSAADGLVGFIRSLEGGWVGGVPCYGVECDMPYANADPLNPEKPQVTFNANLHIRSYEE